MGKHVTGIKILGKMLKTGMANRKIMHVDLDAFFVSVEQALKPEIRGKPVVVGGRTDKRGVVAAASYEARAFGLHAGMPLSTASRLCPQAIFIEGNYLRYRDASKKFMAILADFSPFLEPAGLDEAFLDVTGFESIHGSIHQMALTIKQRIRQEVGINASIGIASCKVVAKVASGRCKPDGLLEIADGKEGTFLAPLPVNKLPGVGKKTERILKGLGILDIVQLSRMPVNALKFHLGASGEVLHRYANGIDERKVSPPSMVKSISRETTFSEDTRNQAFLESNLRYLSEKVGADLRQRQKQAKSINLKLRFADFTTITRSKTLAQPFDTDEIIYQTGSQLLKKVLQAEKQAVRLTGIGVSNFTEPGTQLEMLDTTAYRLGHLNKAIDKIRRKYGFSAIQTGRTLRLRDMLGGGNR